MRQGMSLIVKSTVRWIFGFVLVFGISTVLYGHLTPGGGFAGGVIIACAFILWVLAYGGRGRLAASHGLASATDVLGLGLFAALALLGYVGGSFFLNFIEKMYPRLGTDYALVSAGVIPPMNIAIGLKVGASLFLAFLALASLRIPEAPTDEDVLSSMEEAQ